MEAADTLRPTLRITCAILAGLLSAGLSFIAASSYALLVAVAIVLSLIHFFFVLQILRSSESKLRWALLIVSIPLLVITIDNIGRLTLCFGGTGFRVLT